MRNFHTPVATGYTVIIADGVNQYDGKTRFRIHKHYAAFVGGGMDCLLATG
jgi:hypothetical protein